MHQQHACFVLSAERAVEVQHHAMFTDTRDQSFIVEPFRPQADHIDLGVGEGVDRIGRRDQRYLFRFGQQLAKLLGVFKRPHAHPDALRLAELAHLGGDTLGVVFVLLLKVEKDVDLAFAKL